MSSPILPCPFTYNDFPNGGSLFPTIVAERDPTAQDKLDIGYNWVNKSNKTSWILAGYLLGVPQWISGGNADATTSSFGIVQLATLAELQGGTAPAGAYVPTANDVATVIAGVVAGAVPPANETQAGIAEIATQIETDAGTDDTRIVTPLKLTNFIGASGVPGSFTDLTATGTVSFTGATGAYTITSATASSVGTTGAGIDLTLASAAGRVIVNGEEAAANAITLVSAAGGVDLDAALQVNIASSQNAVDAVRIVASAGGIDIDAVGAATEDINITNTGGSIVLQATESAVDAIDVISTTGGIRLRATGAAAGEDISLTATGSSIVLSATEAVSDAINIDATAGGIDVDAVGQINIATSQSANDSIVIESTAGGIDILASGAGAGEDIDIIATGSSVNVTSTENAAQAIYIRANGGTSETVDIHADQGTGVASINVHSDVGGVTVASGLASADAINIVASNAGGGIDIDAGTAGVIVDTTGGISLDAAAASNFTATGAFDITIQSTAGSILINAGEAAADAVNIDSTGGVDVDAALQINIASSQAAASAIVISASDAAGGVDISTGGGSVDISSAGFVTMVAVADTQASPTAASTINTNVGAATFTGFTTAAAGSQVFTITNSLISATSQVFVTVCNEGVNDAQMTITRVERLAGSMEVTCTNNGAAALNGNVTVSFWVIG